MQYFTKIIKIKIIEFYCIGIPEQNSKKNVFIGNFCNKNLLCTFGLCMKNKKEILSKLKLTIPKRALMLLSGIVWLVPMGILLTKGIGWLSDFPSQFTVGLIMSILGGLFFYRFLFSKISFRYINRIKLMEQEKPCAFSFFSWKGYLMMAGMILLGIVLRTTGVIPILYLSMLYITMAIPLGISAFRFFYHWIKY